MPFIVKPNPRTRHLRIGRIGSPKVQAAELDSISVRHITSHPDYDLIMASMREGIPVAQIARHFALEQKINVGEKTFATYLYVFRRIERARINDFPLDAKTMDKHVRGDQVELDVDREMDRVIRFQKLRIGIGFENEKQLGMPLEVVGKDVRVLGQLIELKAKRKGILPTGAGRPVTVDKNIQDKLTGIKRDEEDHQGLHRLTSELVERISTGGSQTS